MPDTDLLLLFGIRSTIPPIERKRVPQILLAYFETAWTLVAENGHEMPFPSTSKNEGSIGTAFEPRYGADGTSLATSSTIADAIVGIVSYMRQDGFFGSRVSLIRPDVSGKRTVIGTFFIGFMTAVQLAMGQANATQPSGVVS